MYLDTRNCGKSARDIIFFRVWRSDADNLADAFTSRREYEFEG
jgi:hypothetical protein